MKWNDKKSIPDEQTLIEYLLSDEAKDNLLTLVDIPNPPRKYIEKIAICVGEEQCKFKRVAHKGDPPSYCPHCEYHNDEAKRGLDPAPTFKEVELFLTSEETNWKYEVEAICKKDRRIIGYIDLIHRVDLTYSYEAKIDDDWIYRDFRTDGVKHAFIIEAKPKIKVFQQVLRQIKTYKDFIRWMINSPEPISILRRITEFHYVVATYEDLSYTILSAFENENILIMHIEPPNKGQQRLGYY